MNERRVISATRKQHQSRMDNTTTKEMNEKHAESANDDEEDGKELAVNLKLVRDGFTLGPNGEVSLESYTNAFSEINNFFKLLGPMYHFVAYDINRKVAILKAELAAETCQHYADVRTMLDYEVEKGLAGRSSPPSGSLTLLQLHRGLEFTFTFMEDLLDEEEEGQSFGQVVSALYKATVGRFHPPILYTPFSGLLLLLPDRATIRSRIAKGSEKAEEKLKRLMPSVIKAVKETYTATQTLYEERDLHRLP